MGRWSFTDCEVLWSHQVSLLVGNGHSILTLDDIRPQAAGGTNETARCGSIQLQMHSSNPSVDR